MSQRTVIGVIATALVVTMVVLGLMVIGSPTKARNKETDRLRVERLSQLHFELENYANEKGQLPNSLMELSTKGPNANERDDRFDPTRDPETGDLWDYRKIGPTKYEVCATFHEASGEQGRYSVPEPQPGFYVHGSGRKCFTQSVRSGPSPLIDHVQPNVKPPPGY